MSLVTHGFSNLDTVQEIDADFLNAVVDTPLTLQLTLQEVLWISKRQAVVT